VGEMKIDPHQVAGRRVQECRAEVVGAGDVFGGRELESHDARAQVWLESARDETVMLPENRVGKRRQEKNRNGVNAAAPFDDVARLVPRLPIIGSEFLLVHDDALDRSSRRNRSRSSLDGHLEWVRL